MEETFSINDIESFKDLFLPNEDLKSPLHLLVFLENYTLLNEIHAQFKKENLSENDQKILLNEFKYVDMRQEVTKEKLERIFCDLGVEIDDDELNAEWINFFSKALKDIKDSILDSNYFNLYKDV